MIIANTATLFVILLDLHSLRELRSPRQPRCINMSGIFMNHEFMIRTDPIIKSRRRPRRAGETAARGPARHSLVIAACAHVPEMEGQLVVVPLSVVPALLRIGVMCR